MLENAVHKLFIARYSYSLIDDHVLITNDTLKVT